MGPSHERVGARLRSADGVLQLKDGGRVVASVRVRDVSTVEESLARPDDGRRYRVDVIDGRGRLLRSQGRLAGPGVASAVATALLGLEPSAEGAWITSGPATGAPTRERENRLWIAQPVITR